jgi:hypothetical protein
VASALGKAQGANGPTDNVLQIDSEIKSALLAYLKNQPAPGNGFPWVTIVLVGAVLGLLFFVVKKHPSAAPLAGAAPLAITIINQAEHLSKFCRTEFWVLVGVFVLIAVGLMVFDVWKKLSINAPVDNGPEGAKKIFSPFTMGFALLILVVAFVLVARCPECAGCAAKPSADGSHVSVLSTTDVRPLTAALFSQGDSSSATVGVDQLEKEVSAGRQKGDKVLLLG